MGTGSILVPEMPCTDIRSAASDLIQRKSPNNYGLTYYLIATINTFLP